MWLRPLAADISVFSPHNSIALSRTTRRVTWNTWRSTIVGEGLVEPYAFVSLSSVLYVSDVQQHRIASISLLKWFKDTVKMELSAGSPEGKSGFIDGRGSAVLFNRPMGMCISGDARCVYIADCGNSVIRQLNFTNQDVRTVAGLPGRAGSTDGSFLIARFAMPQEICTDNGDRLFVCCAGSVNIRVLHLRDSTCAPRASTRSADSGCDGRWRRVGFDDCHSHADCWADHWPRRKRREERLQSRCEERRGGKQLTGPIGCSRSLCGSMDRRGLRRTVRCGAADLRSNAFAVRRRFQYVSCRYPVPRHQWHRY
jgi:hypothetical protein